jgi:hypothetical protein
VLCTTDRGRRFAERQNHSAIAEMTTGDHHLHAVESSRSIAALELW